MYGMDRPTSDSLIGSLISALIAGRNTVGEPLAGMIESAVEPSFDVYFCGHTIQ